MRQLKITKSITNRESQSLDKYLQDIGREDLITAEQEVELAKKIIDLLSSKSKIVFLPPLIDGDMTRRKPDIAKMMKVLNRDLIDLDSGILKTAKMWKNKEEKL